MTATVQREKERVGHGLMHRLISNEDLIKQLALQLAHEFSIQLTDLWVGIAHNNKAAIKLNIPLSGEDKWSHAENFCMPSPVVRKEAVSITIGISTGRMNSTENSFDAVLTTNEAALTECIALVVAYRLNVLRYTEILEITRELPLKAAARVIKKHMES